MFDGIDPEAVDVGFADPITVGLDEDVDEFGARGIVVVVVVLEGDDVAVLAFWVLVPAVAGDLPAAMVQLGIAQLGRDRPITASPSTQVETRVVGVEVVSVAGVVPNCRRSG